MEFFFRFVTLFLFSYFVNYSSSSRSDDLKEAYLHYCANPTIGNFVHFEVFIRAQFYKFPLESFYILEYNQEDLRFIFMFLWAGDQELGKLDPKHINSDQYPELLTLIIDRIRKEFLTL